MRHVVLVLVLAACGGVQSGPTQSTKDVDGDGVPDVRDRCAYVAGTEALDGCAVVKDGRDGDRDGIVDAEDNCPEDPEDMDGKDDRDGCPEPDRPAIETTAPPIDAGAPAVDGGGAPALDAP